MNALGLQKSVKTPLFARTFGNENLVQIGGLILACILSVYHCTCSCSITNRFSGPTLVATGFQPLCFLQGHLLTRVVLV